MTQLVVRKLDPETKTRLQQRASRHGVSMEEEVRQILRSAVSEPEKGLGTQIADLFRGIEGNDEPLPQLPRSPIRPMSFDE